MRRLLLSLLLLGLVLTAGCKGLQFKEKLTIAKGEPYAEVEFKVGKKERKVKVTAESKVPVNVWVVSMDDKAEAVGALLNKPNPKKPRNVLASEERTKDASFEATVPAGKAFVVLVSPADTVTDEVEVNLDVKDK